MLEIKVDSRGVKNLDSDVLIIPIFDGEETKILSSPASGTYK